MATGDRLRRTIRKAIQHAVLNVTLVIFALAALGSAAYVVHASQVEARAREARIEEYKSAGRSVEDWRDWARERADQRTESWWEFWK